MDFSTKNIQRKEASDTKISETFLDLLKALKTKQPLKVKPIIQKLNNYILNESDEILFTQLKEFMKTYKFKEATILLNKGRYRDE